MRFGEVVMVGWEEVTGGGGGGGEGRECVNVGVGGVCEVGVRGRVW